MVTGKNTEPAEELSISGTLRVASGGSLYPQLPPTNVRKYGREDPFHITVAPFIPFPLLMPQLKSE